jgi:NTE family protein
MFYFRKVTGILLLFATSFTYAQKENLIENLVFEGAGVRGIAYAGAIKELEQKGLLKNVKRVGGTSAGAISALMLTLGYNAEEFTALINSTSFKKFNDGKFLIFGGINRLNKYYGWYRGRQFENWISDLIESKTGNANIDFLGLHQRGLKDLYITGTCLNKQELIVFSYENYPHMKVKDAVRISMSIPFYFEAVFIDSSGKVVNQPKNKKGLDVMADGGFVANFPIRLFDSSRYLALAEPNTFKTNPATIGFRIDSHEQIKRDADSKSLAPMPVSNLKEYTAAFYTIIIENLNRQTLGEEDWKRTISISDGAIGPRIRKLSAQEVKILVENGRSATKKFLQY